LTPPDELDDPVAPEELAGEGVCVPDSLAFLVAFSLTVTVSDPPHAKDHTAIPTRPPKPSTRVVLEKFFITTPRIGGTSAVSHTQSNTRAYL
jgi:hypothetical protein